MKLSAEANVELKWWIDNMPLARKNISRENPLYIIHSDASKLGWGAAMLELKLEDDGLQQRVCGTSTTLNF